MGFLQSQKFSITNFLEFRDNMQCFHTRSDTALESVGTCYTPAEPAAAGIQGLPQGSEKLPAAF